MESAGKSRAREVKSTSDNIPLVISNTKYLNEGKDALIDNSSDDDNSDVKVTAITSSSNSESEEK